MRGDLCIDGVWIRGRGDAFVSIDPGSGELLAGLYAASAGQVAAATTAASRSLSGWSGTPVERRVEIVRGYEDRLRAAHGELSELVSRETGKPRWEARSEVDAMIGKIGISIEMLERRRSEEKLELSDAIAWTRYRPIGVLGVLGPFNLPGHLPNGHIVPALLAGNTIVFKPSELTPIIGARLIELLEDAGLPPGVANLVQGDRSVGQALVTDPTIDGVLFTGSYTGGKAIAGDLSNRPEVLVALEMGGNNPLVVHDAEDMEAALVHTLLSAYITAGQRCTCARRLVLVRGEWGDRFLERLIERIRGLRVGLQGDEPECFLGPMISADAATRVRSAESRLLARGAQALVPLRGDPRSPALLHPGLIDVTDVADRGDEEHFGPMLQVIRVPDFDAAIVEANRTSYGLVAALLSDDRALFERFVREAHAGVIHWNRQTTGASGRLPFGGLGRSGNHRPAGAWSVDYCSDPIVLLEVDTLRMPTMLPPGLDAAAG